MTTNTGNYQRIWKIQGTTMRILKQGTTMGINQSNPYETNAETKQHDIHLKRTSKQQRIHQLAAHQLTPKQKAEIASIQQPQPPMQEQKSTNVKCTPAHNNNEKKKMKQQEQSRMLTSSNFAKENRKKKKTNRSPRAHQSHERTQQVREPGSTN